MLALFAERLEEYGATVHRARGADLASALAEVLSAGRFGGSQMLAQLLLGVGDVQRCCGSGAGW
ncbi:hypothetical protein [Streptomyces sp. NPDC001714]|uniref:hypothetical protein n=1 Tax=Streptomyces sp. NPDC001714 TaxID=3364603 RepID=UPI0036C5D937